MENGASARRSIIGIDFGTTNSCVSYPDAFGEPKNVEVATGITPYDRVLPSVVLNPRVEGARAETKIGHAARSAYELNPKGVYLKYFKHDLDQQRLKARRVITREEPTQEHDFVTETTKMRTITSHEFVGQGFSREELVASTSAILQHLLQAAIEDGADPKSDLLIGVPVNYSGYARKRLICALERVLDAKGEKLFSGFKDVISRTHFVLEPVAVAAAPGPELDISGSENVLVFDHGGGTLDISLIRYDRRDGFARPIPVRELAAGGSKHVAGRHMDEAFLSALLADDTYAEALRHPSLNDDRRREVVEGAKIELSTKSKARVPIADIEVSQEGFEAAIAPILAEVRDSVAETLARGGLGASELGWVVMTGGSSLVPSVQRTVKDLFPDLAERDRVLHYFPDDVEGVESAITDVAEGLARFGLQDEFEQIVLWDVELGREEAGGFVRLFDQGTPYELVDGRPEVSVEVEAPDIGRPGCSFGIYERQLERQFSFGLAEVPTLQPGSRLSVRLRRDSLFPILAITDADGNVVTRATSPTGWPQDTYAAADIQTYEEGALLDFFEEDAEYVPVVRGDKFEHAPLVRRLRVGDWVEWSAMAAKGGLKRKVGCGAIEKIRRCDGSGEVEEMGCWDVSKYHFEIKTKLGTMKLDTRNGCIRLAPRPDPIA